MKITSDKRYYDLKEENSKLNFEINQKEKINIKKIKTKTENIYIKK